MVNLKLAHSVLQDKAASFWLKETIKRGLERDIVDVQNEIETLGRVFINEAKTPGYDSVIPTIGS